MAMPSDHLQKLETEVDELTQLSQKYENAIKTGHELLEEETDVACVEVLKEQIQIAREHLEKTNNDLTAKKEELELSVRLHCEGSTN